MELNTTPEMHGAMPSPSHDDMEQRAVTNTVLRIALWSITLLLTVWAVSSCWWPYGPDQAQLAWVAKEITTGKALYRDVWDNNPPGAILQHTLMHILFGVSMWPSRVIDLVYLILTVWALVAMSKALKSPAAGPWAAILFVSFYALQGFSPTCERDGWAAMQITWAIALVLTRPTILHCALAGLLLSTAGCFKPPFLVAMIPVTMLVVKSGVSADSPWRAIAQLAALILPMACVAFMLFVWLSSTGALSDAFEQVVVFNKRVYGSPYFPLSTAPLAMVERLGQLFHIVILGIAGSTYLFARVERHKHASIGVVWPVMALFILLIQYRFIIYHWYALVISLSLLAGIGLQGLVETLRGAPTTSRRLWSSIVLVIVFAGLLRPCLFLLRDTQLWLTEVVVKRDYEQYLSHFGRFLQEKSTAEYIDAHTLPRDSFQVWGLAPIVNLLSQRPIASHFGHTAYVFSDFNEELNPKLFANYIDQFLQDMSLTRPAYLVVDLTTEGWWKRIEEIPRIDRYVKSNYAYEAQIGSLLLLRSTMVEQQ